MLAGLAPGEAAPRPLPGPRKAEPAFETGHAGRAGARRGSTPPGAGATQGRARLRNSPCWPGWRPARQHPARCRGNTRQSPPPRQATLAGLTPGEAAPRPVPGLRKAEPAPETGHAGRARARQGSTPHGAGATQGRARPRNRPCWPGWPPARQHPARCRGYTRQTPPPRQAMLAGLAPGETAPARCRGHARQSPPPKQAMLAGLAPGKAAPRTVPGLRRAEPATETGHAGRAGARRGSTPHGAGSTQGRTRPVDRRAPVAGERCEPRMCRPLPAKGDTYVTGLQR